jgi:hypothetical protein
MVAWALAIRHSSSATLRSRPLAEGSQPEVAARGTEEKRTKSGDGGADDEIDGGNGNGNVDVDDEEEEEEGEEGFEDDIFDCHDDSISMMEEDSTTNVPCCLQALARPSSLLFFCAVILGGGSAVYCV